MKKHAIMYSILFIALYVLAIKIETRQDGMWLTFTNLVSPWTLEFTEDFLDWKPLLRSTTNLNLNTMEFKVINSNDWKFYRITTN